MTIFVETVYNSDGSVRLDITGEKRGYIFGRKLQEACDKLLSYIKEDDTVFVDERRVGAVTAEILSQVIKINRFCLKKEDFIGGN